MKLKSIISKQYTCSMKHSVATYTQSKIMLCPFEDKRYLFHAINSLPYGHYALGC